MNDDIRAQLERLRPPNRLAEYLDEQNRIRHLVRIFLMGCGRSGTWLLTGIMNTFKGVTVFPIEVDVEFFGIPSCGRSALVLKRSATAYKTVDRIPKAISILYIVRHPYDVLTSNNANRDAQYHITPERWTGEMQALRWLVTSRRADTTIVKYEDLVTNPDALQAQIGCQYGLEIDTRATDYHKVFRPNATVARAMQGLRSPDSHSVGRWKHDNESITYLTSLRRRLGDDLTWLAGEFDYDLTLI